jgi:hypothetical protein
MHAGTAAAEPRSAAALTAAKQHNKITAHDLQRLLAAEIIKQTTAVTCLLFSSRLRNLR